MYCNTVGFHKTLCGGGEFPETSSVFHLIQWHDGLRHLVTDGCGQTEQRVQSPVQDCQLNLPVELELELERAVGGRGGVSAPRAFHTIKRTGYEKKTQIWLTF